MSCTIRQGNGVLALPIPGRYKGLVDNTLVETPYSAAAACSTSSASEGAVWATAICCLGMEHAPAGAAAMDDPYSGMAGGDGGAGR